jgi:GTP pyrophosphokinase
MIPALETTATTRLAATDAVREAAAALRHLALPPAADAIRTAALDVAEIVRNLDADETIVIAAMIGPLLEARLLDPEAARKRFGAASAELARELNRLGHFGLPPDWTPERGLEGGQAEALRKMLLAVVGDVRLVIVRLAEQLQRMRAARTADAATQRRLATESREVYAPLANRLGVWQVKWELEDLAFRYLQPADYRRIAAALKSRRAERERYIEQLTATLRAALGAAGLEATIDGRPKHIYSIWRKMQRKDLAFEQLMDIRAARVLVATVADCYAALGIVHSLWPFIPGEFDDYIATPKDNHYRSIHTAVTGPGGEPVEIQIRTREMHEFAERGVASHWRYKEGGRADLAYERRINELRALLAPPPDGETPGDFLERMRAGLFQDRIYVLSPRGEIVDVPVGGTPLDFAYQVHSDLGHRTRGAKVGGRIVPLDYHLQNGETVEIITARVAQPSRDWLSAQSGYLASPRNRNKVKAWFRRQAESARGAPGTAIEPSAVPGTAPAPDADAVEVVVRQRVVAEPAPDVAVQGIDELLSTFARCCRPVRPEPIVGYITVGRGVSIHAESCANLQRLRARAPERVLAVHWGSIGGADFPVDIQVEAFDRRGLVRDVSAAIADEKISIRGMTTTTGKGDHVARMDIGIAIDGLDQLSRVLARIAQVPNVIAARRRK